VEALEGMRERVEQVSDVTHPQQALSLNGILIDETAVTTP